MKAVVPFDGAGPNRVSNSVAHWAAGLALSPSGAGPATRCGASTRSAQPTSPQKRIRRGPMINRSDLRRHSERLLQEIKTAVSSYEAAPLAATLGAVSAVAGFVSDLQRGDVRFSSEASPDLAQPFLRLALALSSLCEGVSDPLLEPAHRKKAVPHLTVLARAEAAGAMNVLMKMGMNERDAAGRVARALAGSELMTGPKGDPTTVIMNWRKHVLQSGERRTSMDLPGLPSLSQQAAGIYNLMAQSAAMEASELGRNPEVIRKLTLARLRRRHPRRLREES
jgi:hypothetical protein